MKKGLGLAGLSYIGALLSAFTPSPRAADVTVGGGGSQYSPPVIYLNGEIDAQTPAALEAALKSTQKRIDAIAITLERENPAFKANTADGLIGATVWLDSGGGDVEAAIAAGKIARRFSAHTFVLKNASCASACVLIFVGGVFRQGIGKIGLHRPFSASYSKSFTEAAEKHRAIQTAVAQYLSAMNISSRLLDAMDSVPPDEVRWLDMMDDGTRLEELGITGADPVWQDRYDSVMSLNLGISKQEYYAREQRTKAQCPLGGDLVVYFKCSDAVMSGRQ
jgi:hypothetical protein